ncbi:MAG: hypothetical protein IT366_19525 [Candidatus Hydrogenedentes bacterium]|nr:hypothetical protein [Candidatus Hydrogenedentota bacterium]
MEENRILKDWVSQTDWKDKIPGSPSKSKEVEPPQPPEPKLTPYDFVPGESFEDWKKRRNWDPDYIREMRLDKHGPNALFYAQRLLDIADGKTPEDVE